MDWSVVIDRVPELASGLLRTLVLCALSALASLIVGAAVTLAHLRGAALLRYLASVYTALCLGLPLLVLIYILFYALPEYGVTMSSQVVGLPSRRGSSRPPMRSVSPACGQRGGSSCRRPCRSCCRHWRVS